MIGRRDTGAVAIEAVHAWGVAIERGDVGFSRDLEAGGPIGGVDDEAAERLVFEIGGGPEGGGKNFCRGARFGFVQTRPDDGHRGSVDGLLNFGGGFFDVIRRRVAGAHAFKDKTADEDFRVGGGRGFIDIGVAKKFGDAA